ncbi:membrane protein [Azorhizobium oxalatiphilum]|uniref:Membrane protein n=1 Tax=Azorhizobium oxalatiphilum TaxID=980631 RepID=A0A917F3M4_9HYPH|nr:DMT family transporter [Azorhizobium oxalatiphilum]GGF47068.1 membrane protein [Azorhizobium oxalatiphilum]
MTAPATPANATSHTGGSVLRTSTRLGILGAVLTVMVWTNWIVSTRFMMQAQHPLSASLLSFIRFGTAAILLAPAWWRFRIYPRQSPPLALLGLMAAGLPYQFMVLWGLHYAPASEAGPLLAGTLPLFIALLSAVFLRERITLYRAIGVGLITQGVIAVLGQGLFDFAAGTWKGHLAILAAAGAWSVYTIAFRYSRLTGLEAAAFVGLWSVIVLLPFTAADIWVEIQNAPAATLAHQFLTQGLLAGVLALLTYTTAVRHLGASRATALTALTPPMALLVGMLLLGERPGLWQMAGCALIVCGVVAASGVLGTRSRPS